jgi:hypothetical protein
VIDRQGLVDALDAALADDRAIAAAGPEIENRAGRQP